MKRLLLIVFAIVLASCSRSIENTEWELLGITDTLALENDFNDYVAHLGPLNYQVALELGVIDSTLGVVPNFAMDSTYRLHFGTNFALTGYFGCKKISGQYLTFGNSDSIHFQYVEEDTISCRRNQNFALAFRRHLEKTTRFRFEGPYLILQSTKNCFRFRRNRH